MTIHSIVIQKLLSTNAQLGRRVAAHHFKIYTYGFRNGMAIIDSDKTLICMRNACNFIGSLARENGRFMFINTNPLFDEIFEQMTKKIGCYSPSANALWRTGGFLTNSGSPKKFRSRNKKLSFGPAQPPDCVVIMDTERKSSVIKEADKLQIPIVALVDSSMPLDYYKRIAYPVPANDSVQFVYLFCNLITKTFMLEQKKLAATENEPKIQAREEMASIEQSKNKLDFAKLKVVVVPYDSLAPITEDTADIKQLLEKLVVLKFNGSLGTQIGLTGPRSAVDICKGLTFLDLIVSQIESLNSKYGCKVPLFLLNSVETHDDTLKVLEKYSNSSVDMHCLKQSQHLQLKSSGQHNREDLCPDHGAAFLSLISGGTLDILLSQGKEYVLVIGSENVATIIDPKMLNHLMQDGIEYCMEVTPPRSSFDSVVYSHPRSFQLMEIAQNSVKHERDNDQVLLQETAVGSAIRFFDDAIGIIVPQSRFLPMNATSDLLLLQSDLYSSKEGILTRNPSRINPVDPMINLGSEFEKTSDFLSRFRSIPSIIELDSLTVRGDVWFGENITLKGRVSIAAKPGMKLEIPDGVVIENKVISEAVDM
ncbi:UTP--glucose-1-phosphate uridylyltransferase [Quillaja saponaria]|uniref:UTP--glucose-1-phosphate uridylyltransferase n=1 Tax=Quillaja saponaria TaxID=32244 RepID=A0AAD7LPH5_QUISA|nr:UTP--glucose-1-phosphate uridylyltransferase [Quillaja saponaria]